MPNVRKMSQLSVHISNDHKIYQHFPILGPPKFDKIGIFGLKRNHLATLQNSARTDQNDFQHKKSGRIVAKLFFKFYL
jgi:hypothetical protein